MNFWELVVLHSTPSLVCRFLVHAWMWCGGSNRDHSILVIEGQTPSVMPRGT